MDMLWIILIGTSIWVYADARAIGVRKGLNPGLLDLGPAGWAVGCLLLWIVFFPVYAGTRGKLKELAANPDAVPAAAPKNKEPTIMSAILFTMFVGIALFVYFIYADRYIGSDVETPAADPVQAAMHDIHSQVIDDALKEYGIASRQGDRTQICVQAGFVAAAYLQAHREAEYNKWKAIQKKDCDFAGM